MYWKMRLTLLWKFIKLIPRARELEIECQKLEQKMHDIQFSHDIAPGSKDAELARAQGMIEGIKFCIGKFNG